MAKYNSVPLGQAGTGSAFILGDDSASKIFNRNAANLTAVNQQRKIDAQKQAQLLAKSYRDNILAASDGKLFAQQLGEIEQRHLKQGMDYRGQGFDIYNPDPNDPKQLAASAQYMADRRQIENLRSYRKGIEDRYKVNSDLLAKAPAGEYDPTTIQAMNDFVSKGNIQDIYANGETLPELSKRFNISTALKGIKAPTFERQQTKNGIIIDEKYIDRDEAENTVLGTLSNNPSGLAELSKVTQGIPVNQLRNLPESYDKIRADIVSDAKGDPNVKVSLAANGIKIGTPAFDKWVDDRAKNLHSIKRNFDSFLDNGVAQISGGVAQFSKKKAEMTEYQKRSLALRAQTQRRLASGKTTENIDVIPSAKNFYTLPDKDNDNKQKLVATVEDYIPVNPVSIGMGQVQNAYDIQSGKNVILPAKGSLEVIGAGHWPVKGGGKELRVIVTDKDGNEYAINERHVPVQTKAKKEYRAVIDKLKGTKTSTPIKGKTYAGIDANGNPIFK